MPDPTDVRLMFSRIARRYDLLNRTLSAGIDQRWRRRVVRRVQADLAARAPARDEPVADICCGTGDLAFLLARAGRRTVGVDFTRPMLERTHAKRGPEPVLFVEGDAQRLPLADSTVAATTVAFGIRNLGDRAVGLREMARVVRPGGRVWVLEFTTPRGLFGWIYRLYFTRMLPLIGRVISRDHGAYEYLPRSVLAWPSCEQLRDEMQALGLEDCSFERWTLGVAALHSGRVPGGGAQ